MTDLFTLQNLGNLGVLIFLQAVLGFDNLLYVSIESKRAPEKAQAAVRRNGIIIAVILRIVLLFAMLELIESLKAPFFVFAFPGVLEGGVNFATAVFVFGGVFIIYTAFKEITHMLSMDDLAHGAERKGARTPAQVIALIVMMNLIFSFDSILSALAITHVFPVLAAAILVSGAVMLALADGVTEFLNRNRMYEVLGLFILLIVGVVLLGEAGPAAAHAMHDETLQLRILGYELLPMSKTTFYFSVVVLVLVELVQSRYQRKLAKVRSMRSG